MFLVLKLLTLLFLVSCFYLGPGLSSAPAAPPSPLLIGVSVALLALVFLGLERFAPAWLNKGFTLLAFCVTLIGPGIFTGMLVTTRFEQHDQRQAHEELVRQLTTPGHTRELSLYLLSRPEGTQDTVQLASAKDLEHLEQYVLSLSPEELREHHLAESLLLGIPLQTDPRLDEPLTDALCRLYLRLKERSGFSAADAPLALRYRDRLVSRVAELGRARWLEELGHEHPVFQGVVIHSLFYENVFLERVPRPLGPGEHLVSRSLGSLPMHVVMDLNLEQVPSPPGLEPPSDNPDYDEYLRRSASKRTREALAVMKSRGVDFTEDELRDPELQTLLETIRATPPPATP